MSNQHPHSKRGQLGFTLIELLVVISIIGLLSSAVLGSLNSARTRARTAAQHADLDQLRKALELYYTDNQSYPDTGGWSSFRGESSLYGSYGYGATGYIPGLVPTYMSRLPTNPNLGRTINCPNETYTGYLYVSNGADYKLMAHCSAEGTWDASYDLYDPIRPTWAWQISTPGGRDK